MNTNTLQIFPIIILFILSSINGFCQTYVNYNWVQNFGNPDLNSDCASIVDKSGNTFFTGNNLSPTQGTDILIMKYNKEGKLIWQKIYNHPSNANDYGKDIISDQCGNIYVVGTSRTRLPNGCDFTLIKINNKDTIEWVQQYRDIIDTNNVAVIVDNDLNIIVAGSSSNSASGCDFVILKYSPAGKLLWSTTYDYCKLDDILIDVEVNKYNEVLVTGTSYLNDSISQITIIKYDSLGNEVLIRREPNQYGGIDEPIGICKDNDGNYLLACKINDSTGYYNIHTLKLDNDLQLLWSMTYDGYSLDDEPTDICIDNNNNVIVTGLSVKENFEKEWVSIKYSSIGNEIWIDKKLINGYCSKLGGIVCTDKSNNILLAHSDNVLGDKNILTSLINPDNAFIWAIRFTQDENWDEFPVDIFSVDDFKFNLMGYISGKPNKYFLLQYKYFHIDNRVLDNPSSQYGYYKNTILVRFNHRSLKLKPYNRYAVRFKEIGYYLEKKQLKRIMKRMPKGVLAENIWTKRVGKSTFLIIFECNGKEKEIAKSISRVFPLVLRARVKSLVGFTPGFWK